MKGYASLSTMVNKHILNRFKLKKAFIVAAVLVFSFILVALCFVYLNPAYAESSESLSFNEENVSRQQNVERYLLSAYQAGKFTFTAPLLVQDPYQMAPLTALAIFDTPEDSQISIHVPGKSSESAVDFTFPGFRQHHEIPIYGLYAGMLNHVTMRLQTESGQNAQTVLDLQTEPLPVYIKNFTINKLDPGKYDPGFNFAFLADGLEIFDLDGNIRWFSPEASYQVFTKLENGRFLRTYSEGQEGEVMVEQDLLGKIFAIYDIKDGIHHDVYELPNGNLLITSSDLRSDTTKDYLIEADRKNGHIVRSFDLKDILDPGRPHQVLQLAAHDWLHLNSITYDPSDQTIIISSKGQSAVIKMTYPGMKIKWILGPHDNWSPKYQPYLLNPLGDNFEWQWSQHHATLYSPQIAGDNSIELLLFNNANYRSFTSAAAYPPSEWYSMVVHYRINEADMTVELVWEYGREIGSDTFSAARGSAYRLENGDILGTWGDIYKDAFGNPSDSSSADGTSQTRIIEVNPSTNEVVFECSALAETYRAMRLGLYDGYSEESPYLSTVLNNTAGNDLYDRSVLAQRDVKRWIVTPMLSTLRTWVRQIRSVIQ
jgi:arylsulfate sulfotransferase